MNAIGFDSPTISTRSIIFSRQNRSRFLGFGSLGFGEAARDRRRGRRPPRFPGRSQVISSASLSAWDEKPFEPLPGGRRSYLDEEDVATFLDPPKELVPLDPSSFNPAAYLWKKIGDVPEERRHRLLNLLRDRLISRAWEITGMRYDDPNLVKLNGSSLLSRDDDSMLLEMWSCRTSKGPSTVSWMKAFNVVGLKSQLDFFRLSAIFRAKDGKTYGRVIPRASLFGSIFTSSSPLYFTLSQLKEVMPTEQPCDLAFEFGDGVLDLQDYPGGFPKPEKHPFPFDDHLVIYIRHAGPGVLVGQAWQEGKELEQVPKKFCGEILMVKDHTDRSEDK
ncbi:hypothetical protein QJS04_geneDACA022890 [Acorus gramineus]|uniref:Uncharacterized protein n=1 Tax=Acorus gramineus TaxID=55184 RepID=A0AAV9AZN8_ACOGR|nr:hypothetical protein QJS04_geneDACA022890 [Acorus gramineus]